MWKRYCLLACLLAAQNIEAQTVETVVSHPRIVDGIHVDAAGFIYTTPGGLMQGLAIGRATPEGGFDPNFRTGFSGPIDIDENGAGLLFVTNYDDNTLKSYDPATGAVATVLSGLDGPAGLALDSEGNIFVTCFGAFPAYSGNQVIKVKPDGSSETWLETTDFFRPQGVAFDDEGHLWVANTPTGKIFRIDTTARVPELVLELGAKAGNLVFRKKDRRLYFPSQGNHRIYRMDLQGNLDTLAGTGTPGSIDGDAAGARFNRPLGLGFTVSEDTLYVAEAGRLRRITGLDEQPAQAGEKAVDWKLRVAPNPSTGSVKVEIPAALAGRPCILEVSDGSGRVAFRQEAPLYGNAIFIDGLKAGVWYVRLFSDGILLLEKML
ncbi:MAG: NHL repeat-containing protein, partial [Phaeodactylibacter sp.]|nr:NHL repeat-containing protein [Phaeodactylibacter sp.]